MQHTLPFMWCRIFQQQFCQLGKPVVVRGVKPGFLWDPDTLQRATINLKGMYGQRKDKSAAKVQQKMPTPLTVRLFPWAVTPWPHALGGPRGQANQKAVT